jgi:hypothetical protein
MSTRCLLFAIPLSLGMWTCLLLIVRGVYLAVRP